MPASGLVEVVKGKNWGAAYSPQQASTVKARPAAIGTTETITHLFSKPILEWGPLTVSVEFATEKDAEETRPGQIFIAFPLRPPRPLR